jgi:hypothetical protein
MEDYEELKEILGTIRILDNLGNNVLSTKAEEMNLRKTLISRLARMSRYGLNHDLIQESVNYFPNSTSQIAEGRIH